MAHIIIVRNRNVLSTLDKTTRGCYVRITPGVPETRGAADVVGATVKGFVGHVLNSNRKCNEKEMKINFSSLIPSLPHDWTSLTNYILFAFQSVFLA